MACVTKRKGRWCVDFYDQHGKRRLKVSKKGSTKKQATVLLREIEEQVGKGTFMPTKQIPLFQEVAKDWIEYKKPNLRETTWGVYEGHVRNHFQVLDYLKINRIQTPTVEKFIRTKQDSGMHILTLRKVLVTLGQIFNYAVRHRYIDYNPLREAERPRSKGNEGESQRDRIKILTPKHINKFLDKTEGQKYRMLFKLAIFSGGRQGELLGLKWSDVDWKNNQIHIQRTFNNGRFFDVKTLESNRQIDIGPKIMADLKRWKLACPIGDLDLVFPNEVGKPIDHHNMVYRVFLPTLTTAALPRIRFHDLRHTYASLLIEQGENPKYIQSQLGHSSPTVTMNVYAHLMKPTNPRSAQRLENTVFNTNGD